MITPCQPRPQAPRQMGTCEEILNKRALLGIRKDIMRYLCTIRIWRGHGPKSNSQTSDGFDCTAPEISLFNVDTSKSPAVLCASSSERVLMVMVMVERSKRRRLSRRPKRLPKSLETPETQACYIFAPFCGVLNKGCFYFITI